MPSERLVKAGISDTIENGKGCTILRTDSMFVIASLITLPELEFLCGEDFISITA
jgi:hypothetical protein